MMTTLISFLIVLGLLIFIHELGHFAVAKLAGVGVEKFSLGFGPKIIGFTRGETEYMISLLPLGGYVKMVGESPDEEISPELREKSFTHKPVLWRAAIVGAGPVMNLILAFVLLPVIFMMGTYIPAYLEQRPEVGYVIPDKPAAKAGIKKGDIIRSLDEKKVSNWEDLISSLSLTSKKTLKVDLERGGKTIETELKPVSDEAGMGDVGILPPMRPVIGGLSPGYPAREAGLEEGDVIVAVNGHEITHWVELEGLVSKDGSPKVFTIKRGDAVFKVKITPKAREGTDRFLIGVNRKEDRIFRSYGFVESVGKGFTSSVDMTWKLFVVIKGLVVGQYSLKTLGGPIMIAQVAGQAAKDSVADLLLLVAFLSLQLGIINLFPIPVLDGGHIMFFIYEAVKGKPMNERLMVIAQQIGIALIITLMILVTYNDIFRIIG
ncbi:MAG: RIP metalloprotease RseP [Thermodesulfobacteriota bacterium]|nr:MAG: RIP metalloprotease RseP [Thermodesulfobacteriota bacterium]